MWSLVLSFGERFLTSRVGLAFIACALLWGWHAHDKRQALNTAREGYVREFELTAAQAELAEMRRRKVAAEMANRTLEEKVQAATGEAMRFAAELEVYERETQINSDGVVDRDLLGRLRAN